MRLVTPVLAALALAASCRAPVKLPETPERRMESGLVVRDLVVGGGNEVVQGSRVTVHYIGRFSDGRPFDSSHDRGQPLRFTVGAGEVVPGWEQGMLGMREGGQRRIAIPPALGFANDAAGAGQTLDLEVELLEVEAP
jgi:FKBP-type peptidyl-prolyl cis-trans isomerase